MTKDELKKRLHCYRDQKAERGQIAAAYHALADPKSANLDGMPKSPGSGDPLASIATKRQALLKRYHEKLDELDAALLTVEDMIDGLEPGERKLMRHRYIDGLTWEEVCVAIGYSWRQTHNIHAKCLDKLMEIYGEEV